MVNILVNPINRIYLSKQGHQSRIDSGTKVTPFWQLNICKYIFMIGFQRSALPKNWRQQVVKLLITKGICINTEKVYSVLRGKVTDKSTVKAVHCAIRKIHGNHIRKKRLDGLRPLRSTIVLVGLTKKDI